MCDSFEDGRFCDGFLSSAVPIVDRFFVEGSFGKVMGNYFRPCLANFGNFLFERHGDFCVQYLTRGAQQGAVSGVLH